MISKIYNKEFREKLKQNPSKYAKEIGIEYNDSSELVVLENTKNKFYIPITDMTKERIELDAIQAAGTGIGIVGTFGNSSSSSACVAGCAQCF